MKKLFRNKFKEIANIVTGVVYAGIAELPLVAFRRCLVHGDLIALVMPGKALPTADVLRGHWDSILTEYIVETSGEDELADLFERVRSKSEEARIHRCRLLVLSHWEMANDEVADALMEEGFEVPGEEAIEADRQAALKMVLESLNGDELRLEIAKEVAAVDVPEEPEASKPSGKINDAWFVNITIAAGELVGYRVPPDSISTLEFCQLYKRLRDAAAKRPVHEQNQDN